MSKYTTQLRFPIEQRLKELGKENLEENWGDTYAMLGLSDYPIFDEAYRSTLNDKIIRRYYFREIGFETMGQFSFMLRRTMHEIMPYYNQLYESLPLVTDPMKSLDRNYDESWNRDTESESESSADSTNKDRNVYQDTPMNGLDTGAIEAMDYATNVTFDNGSSESSSEASSKSNDNGWRVHHESGFNESQSDLLMKYRKTFINVDLEIVDRLNGLFMGLW